VRVVLFRVDDRLIHGQVVLGWGRRLLPSRVVVVDDRIAADPWERDLLASAAPPEMPAEFLTVRDAARAMGGGAAAQGARAEGAAADDAGAVVLFETPATALRLADEGFTVPELNLGGLHREGGREVTPYLFVLPADDEALRELARRGTRLYALDVPDGKRVEAAGLLRGAA
jgi:PTS system mannose-specific IIB component/fructoselysine and glucoselysine-specific PTS system IIB component